MSESKDSVGLITHSNRGITLLNNELLSLKGLVCNKCGKPLSLLRWNEQVSLVICDNLCEAYHRPIGHIGQDNTKPELVKKRRHLTERHKQAIREGKERGNKKQRWLFTSPEIKE